MLIGESSTMNNKLQSLTNRDLTQEREAYYRSLDSSFNVRKFRIFECPEEGCPKSFKERGNLKVHLLKHTGEKPFICDFEKCNKRFSTKGNLKTHRSHHTGYKPFVCVFEKCSKSYTNECRLRVHLRTHTGECPFICRFCNKKFNEKGNLKTHLRIHTGEKPYECEHEGCGMKFKAYGHLKDHMTMHLKIKPYICPECKNGFARSSTLRIHMRTHTGEKPFTCPHNGCNKQFTEKGNMKTHYKKHGIKIESQLTLEPQYAIGDCLFGAPTRIETLPSNSNFSSQTMNSTEIQASKFKGKGVITLEETSQDNFCLGQANEPNFVNYFQTTFFCKEIEESNSNFFDSDLNFTN